MDLCLQSFFTARHSFTAQQACQHAIFFRNMVANRKSGAFFPADSDSIRLDQFTNVLEAHRSLVQRDSVLLRESIDHVGSRHRFGYTIFPATSVNQVDKQHCTHVVGLDKCPIRIDNPKAVGITISRDAESRSSRLHYFAQIVQEVSFRFGSVSTKENVARVVHSRYFDSSFAKQLIGIAPSSSPERIVSNFDS